MNKRVLSERLLLQKEKRGKEGGQEWQGSNTGNFQQFQVEGFEKGTCDFSLQEMVGTNQ